MMESMIDDRLQHVFQHVKSMTPKTLKMLHEEGITTMRRQSMCSVDDMSSIEGVSDNKARAIIHEARERLSMCELVAVRDLDEKREWFTTGSENVDDLMDGGITTGRITELFGGTARIMLETYDPRSLKTNLFHSSEKIHEKIRRGEILVYQDNHKLLAHVVNMAAFSIKDCLVGVKG